MNRIENNPSYGLNENEMLSSRMRQIITPIAAIALIAYGPHRTDTEITQYIDTPIQVVSKEEKVTTTEEHTRMGILFDGNEIRGDEVLRRIKVHADQADEEGILRLNNILDEILNPESLVSADITSQSSITIRTGDFAKFPELEPDDNQRATIHSKIDADLVGAFRIDTIETTIPASSREEIVRVPHSTTVDYIDQDKAVIPEKPRIKRVVKKTISKSKPGDLREDNSSEPIIKDEYKSKPGNALGSRTPRTSPVYTHDATKSKHNFVGTVLHSYEYSLPHVDRKIPLGLAAIALTGLTAYLWQESEFATDRICELPDSSGPINISKDGDSWIPDFSTAICPSPEGKELSLTFDGFSGYGIGHLSPTNVIESTSILNSDLVPDNIERNVGDEKFKEIIVPLIDDLDEIRKKSAEDNFKGYRPIRIKGIK